MRREICASCGLDDLIEFLDLGDSPIADAYTSTATESSKTYPLEVAVCNNCHLAQLLEVLDGQTLFGTGYSFYSSSSAPLSGYHRDYANAVLHAHRNTGFVLEIGCNDGDMLHWFDGVAGKTLGVDPASGPVAKARGRGLDVVEKEFTFAVAQELRQDHGPADVIVANHVLAHVADVNDFLRGVAEMLARNGTAYVEVQYVGDLLVNNAFDLVYHEHRNFFSLSSLSTAASAAGLVVTDVQFTRRQQGSIRVKMRRRDSSPLVEHTVRDYLASESWLRSGFGAYAGMQGHVERVRMRLWDLLADAIKLGQVAGYGAPAKATTLLNYCDIGNEVLDYIVDSTPAKQGRFIPGVGIPIIAPDPNMSRPSTYLLLAWNYLHEIVPRESTLDFQRWIIPLPGPVLL